MLMEAAVVVIIAILAFLAGGWTGINAGIDYDTAAVARGYADRSCVCLERRTRGPDGPRVQILCSCVGDRAAV